MKPLAAFDVYGIPQCQAPFGSQRLSRQGARGVRTARLSLQELGSTSHRRQRAFKALNGALPSTARCPRMRVRAWSSTQKDLARKVSEERGDTPVDPRDAGIEGNLHGPPPRARGKRVEHRGPASWDRRSSAACACVGRGAREVLRRVHLGFRSYK